jgi:tetratricopeptide (TPR) repeat protein
MTRVLASRLKSVLQKRQGLALALWGEAGIGKSHQVRELLQTLACHSSSLHATAPLATLAQTLPRPKKLATWAERTLARLARGEAVELNTVTDALGATLAGLAPFVLHLEDLHEAEQERSSFIQELAKVVLRSKGVGFVVTSRRKPSEPFTAIKLEPLSRQESDALLETELKASLPKAALAWLYHQAAGNPLYTLEYLRYLTRQGFLWSDGKTWHWREPEHTIMPVTVEALIEQLLTGAKAEPLQKCVLETKAFLPLTTDGEVWSKVARINKQELQTAITELAQQGIFKENDFAHPLFREVALKTLSTERKQNLARRAINVLEHEPEQAALFVEDAKLEPEKALALLKKAADHVKARSEVETARFLAKAVGYATGEEKVHLMLNTATALQLHDAPQAIKLIEQLLQEQPNHTEALYLAATLYANDLQEVKAEQAFAQLPKTERESQRGFETLLNIKNSLNKYDDFLNLWQQHPEQRRKAGPVTIAKTVFVLSQHAKAQEAITLARETLERDDLSEWPRAVLLNALGVSYNDGGAHEQAENVFTQLIALGVNHLGNRNMAISFYNRALARKWLGHYAEARSDGLESYRWANEAGSSYEVGKALCMLGEVSVELGDYEQAEDYLNNSLSLFRQRPVTPFVVDAEANLARLYLSWVSPHSKILALKHAYAALAAARAVEDAYSLVDGLFYASITEASYGTASKALELANELEPLARRNSNPLDIYYAAWAKAVAHKAIHQNTLSATLFTRAYEVAGQIKHELNKHKIGLELDRLNNDLESARQRMGWFEERALTNGVNIAKRYFPQLADRKEPAKPPETQVRLEVLGTLQLTQGSKTQVRGRKRQELLALLLEARISGRSEISRLTLFDTLYPDEDEHKVSGSLKSLVHSLRETLGETAIKTTNNGYALGECTSDAELFLQTLDTALWRGTYLEDIEFSDDSTVRESLYMSLFEKTKILLETNPKEAARVGGILVEAEPYNTEYLKTYLTALRLSKNHGRLTRHYQEARERLLEVGETLPETWQNFLTT